MTTILQATFDRPEPVRQALSGLGLTGSRTANVIACATHPPGKQPLREGRDGELRALEHGVRAGAAAGSALGAAIALSAAVSVSAAAGAFVAVTIIGAGLGALGGSVAGAILEAGYGLDQESRQRWEMRVLVTITAERDQVAGAEAVLVQPGGQLQHADPSLRISGQGRG